MIKAWKMAAHKIHVAKNLDKMFISLHALAEIQLTPNKFRDVDI